MTQRDSLQKDREPRRFDVTLVGDTNLDLLMYGLSEELPCEDELLANEMAIRAVDPARSRRTIWALWEAKPDSS